MEEKNSKTDENTQDDLGVLTGQVKMMGVRGTMISHAFSLHSC